MTMKSIAQEQEADEPRVNLEDLWKETFSIGRTEWDLLNQFNWDFSNLKDAFQEGGELCGKKLYLFGHTQLEIVMFKGERKIVCIPVLVAITCPTKHPTCIVHWDTYIPFQDRPDTPKSQIFILSRTQTSSALKHLEEFDYCLPYFRLPLKEDALEHSTEVQIIFPAEPNTVFCVFDWKLDKLESFTNNLIKEEELSEDQKDAFKEFVKEKVREEEKDRRKAREALERTIEEMSEETRAALESRRFYKFYPVQSPDAPDVSDVKVPFINRYYGEAHKVL